MGLEEWRDIVGYEGLYQVSNLGRVKSVPHLVKNRSGCRMLPERILKQRNSSWGGNYLQVQLYNRQNRECKAVHRLVAEAFHINPENKCDVNHIDGNKQNNCASNLEWATRSENIQHAMNTGLHGRSRKGKGYPGVVYIKKLDKYWVSMQINKKRTHIGYYPTYEEALQARLDFEKAHNIEKSEVLV